MQQQREDQYCMPVNTGKSNIPEAPGCQKAGWQSLLSESSQTLCRFGSTIVAL